MLKLASGAADALTGRFFTVFDDLDALILKAEAVKEQDLHTLRLRK